MPVVAVHPWMEWIPIKNLVTSQGQAVIKLLEKKDNDKRLLATGDLSLLNVDYKIISKIFASRLKKYFQILSHLSKPLMLHEVVLAN